MLLAMVPAVLVAEHSFAKPEQISLFIAQEFLLLTKMSLLPLLLPVFLVFGWRAQPVLHCSSHRINAAGLAKHGRKAVIVSLLPG